MEDTLEDLCETLNEEVDDKLSRWQRHKVSQALRLRASKIESEFGLSQNDTSGSDADHDVETPSRVQSLSCVSSFNAFPSPVDVPRDRKTTDEKLRQSKFHSIMKDIESHRMSQQQKVKIPNVYQSTTLAEFMAPSEQSSDKLNNQKS